MGKAEEEIADRTLSVSNYFYCPKSPFLLQSGLLGSCKKSSPSHSSPGDLSRPLSCCGAKACCIHLASDQQRHLWHPHAQPWLGPSSGFPPDSLYPGSCWACGSACLFSCCCVLRCGVAVKLLRRVCYHFAPLAAIMVFV